MGSDGFKFLLECPTSAGREGCSTFEGMPQLFLCTASDVFVTRFSRIEGMVDKSARDGTSGNDFLSNVSL